MKRHLALKFLICYPKFPVLHLLGTDTAALPDNLTVFSDIFFQMCFQICPLIFYVVFTLPVPVYHVHRFSCTQFLHVSVTTLL